MSTYILKGLDAYFHDECDDRTLPSEFDAERNFKSIDEVFGTRRINVDAMIHHDGVISPGIDCDYLTELGIIKSSLKIGFHEHARKMHKISLACPLPVFLKRYDKLNLTHPHTYEEIEWTMQDTSYLDFLMGSLESLDAKKDALRKHIAMLQVSDIETSPLLVYLTTARINYSKEKWYATLFESVEKTLLERKKDPEKLLFGLKPN